MLTDVIDALDRRYQAFARSASPAAQPHLLAELHEFMVFLGREPRLSSTFARLGADAVAAIETFRARDAALVADLVRSRNALAERAPSIDDSQRVAPTGQEDPIGWSRSLAWFDATARATDRGVRVSIYPDDSDDEMRTTALLNLLRRKYAEAALAVSQDGGIDAELRRASERLLRLRREWMLFSRTSVEAAVLRMVLVDSYVLPEERPIDRAMIEVVNEAFHEHNHPLHDLRARLYGDQVRADDGSRDATLTLIIAGSVTRVYEGLRASLGTTRSHRALVERFRLRAELYDAEELRQLAGAASRPEDALADRLARFLFDNGLNPLTRPLVGGLSPDMLDRTAPWTLYIEAKQYRDDGHGRGTIVDGLPQVWDTLARLQGHPTRLHEAFYVVFRRAGPRYVLPERLESEGVVVYPVLIDIGDVAQSGSRQRHKPIQLDAAELLPQAAPTGASR